MKTTAAAVTTALLSFVIGALWVFADARMFVQYFYTSRMVAVAHTFTLGWVSLMIVGVLRQLGPVAFGLQLRRASWISGAVALWIPALIAMIFGFATYHYAIAGIGASVLLISALAIISAFLAGFRGVRREPPHQHLLASLLYFAAAAALGASMGLAKGFDWPLPAAFHMVLFAHIHLAGAGWAGMMILAIMSRLFPQAHLRRPLPARLRFIAFHVGLIGLAAGLLLDQSWFRFFGAVLAASCIWYAAAFIPVLREFQQPSDQSTKFLASAWAFLAVVAAIGLWLSTGIGEMMPLRMQLQFVYGFVYMFGWLSLMIFGMLYRILPTHVSKLLTARGLAPTTGLRRTLIDPPLQTAAWTCLVSGLCIAAIAIVLQNPAVFRLGWALWLAGIAAFIIGLVRLGVALRAIVGASRVA